MNGTPYIKSLAVVLLAFALTAFTFLHRQQKKKYRDLEVVIIRHAEKPGRGDNLSCRGFNRALHLPEVITGQFGVPDEVYVASPRTGHSTKSGRMMQTVWPMAVKYNLPLNTRYHVGEGRSLARHLLGKTGTILVVWEHQEIPEIARELGVKGQPLVWSGNDYDGIWVIKVKGKATAGLTLKKENIIPGDPCTF